MTNLADRVYEQSTTTGTGTMSLGGAPTGFQSFVGGIGNGNPCYYVIEHPTLDEWEIGIGTVTDGTPDTLSRDTVLKSSNSDNLVNFSAGSKAVRVTLPASVVSSISAPIVDTTAVVKDPADGTKRMRIDCGAVATMTTRVLTMPDQDIDLTPNSGTFAAASHASRHQHGGADEIATATAGANAIPKAGAGGTLATAWLPGALPSLSAYNTNGLLTQTAANTFTGRTISGGTGVSVTNGDGVSGNPSVAIGQSVAISAAPQFERIGIGGAAGSTVGISLGNTALTSTIQIGVSASPVGNSAATSFVVGQFSKPQLASASFTCADLAGFLIDNPSAFSGGAAATRLSGIYILDQTRGTSNYGVRCSVSAGSNKWNWYGDGTANNLTNGAWIFGQMSSAPTPGSNQAAIYSLDNAGTAELYVKDEGGTQTPISPHPAAVLDPHPALMASVNLAPVRVPWGMDSTNDLVGVRTTADIAAALRCVEYLMAQAGKPITLITETDIPRGPSWSDRQLTAAGDHQTQVEDFDGQVDAWRDAVAVEAAKPFWARQDVPFFGRNPGTFVQKPEPVWLAAARLN